MRTRFVFSALLAVLSTACVASVHPFYGSGDLIQDPGLIGSWADSASSERAVITRPAGRDYYAVAYTDDKNVTSRFAGRLARVKGRLLLDLSPDTDAIPANDDIKRLLYPMHTFVFLDAVGPRVHVRALNPDSLDKMIKTNPASFPHIATGSDGWAFSAPSPELTTFIDAFARRPGALGDPETWMKR